MDKKGVIHEHSKIKLELYRLYLESYLSVLLTTSFYERIVVSDVFAGCGVAKNEEKGSAIIGAETIEKIKTDRNPRNKDIILNLNDVNRENCLALQKHLEKCPFVHITNQEANQYIQSWQADLRSHNLFFIDPNGYTQVSIENLKRLFMMPRSDFLIFVPISHLFRFKEVDAETKPVKEFLTALGIKYEDIVKADDINPFADLITGALQKISDTELVYKYIIKNRIYNISYCLFFITHSIRGAEKFIEAQQKLEKEIKDSESQRSFDFVADLNKRSILDFIDDGETYDNISLYELGIKKGFLPKELNKELIKLEQEGVIVVAALSNNKRPKNAFYINYKHRAQGNRLISVTFRK